VLHPLWRYRYARLTTPRWLAKDGLCLYRLNNSAAPTGASAMEEHLSGSSLGVKRPGMAGRDAGARQAKGESIAY